MDLEGLNRFATWLMHRIDGVEEVLQSLSPGLHFGRDGDPIYEVGTRPKVQRAPIERPTRAWAELPAIRRAVQRMPVVAPAAPFRADLAGASPPPPILAPLSHGRGLDAPRGLVSGIARPAERTAGPAVPKPVQRTPMVGGRRAEAGEEPDVSPGTSPVGRIEAEPALGSTGPATPAPGRRLAVASDEARPAARSLTRAPETPLTARHVGLVGQPVAAGNARRAAEPTFATVQRAPAAPPSAPSAAASAAGSVVPPHRPEAPRLTIGQARRLGLGAPIAGGPLGSEPTMSARRDKPETAGPPRLDLAKLGRPSAPASQVESTAAGPAVAPAAAPVASGLPAGATAVAARDRRAGPSLPVPVSTSPQSLPRPQPAGAAGAAPPAPTAPIVSARPLLAAVQRAPIALGAPDQADATARSPEEESHPPGAAPGSLPSVEPGVKVHRGAEATQMASALDARSFSHGGEIYLPASHGSLTSGAGRSLLAHELTHVVQQRRLGSSLPLEHTPHGRSLEAEAVAAERSGSLPLAPTATASPSRGTTAAPSAQRAPAVEVTAGDTTTIHLPAPVQRAPGKASPPIGEGPAATRRSEQELEDLAGQLYARIGRRLRRELLVERERTGLALDVR